MPDKRCEPQCQGRAAPLTTSTPCSEKPHDGCPGGPSIKTQEGPERLNDLPKMMGWCQIPKEGGGEGEGRTEREKEGKETACKPR